MSPDYFVTDVSGRSLLDIWKVYAFKFRSKFWAKGVVVIKL